MMTKTQGLDAMTEDQINTLLAQVEATDGLDVAVLGAVSAKIADRFPSTAALDFDGLSVTDGALHLVDTCLPGWTISLHGKALEPDGHWRCSLRESSSRDNDAFVGVGQGATVGQAMLVALLKLVKSGAGAQ